MGWVTPVNGIKTHGEIHTIKSCQTFIYTLYIYIYRRETRGVMVYGKMVNIYGLLHYHAIYYIVYLKLVYILLLYISKTY